MAHLVSRYLNAESWPARFIIRVKAIVCQCMTMTMKEAIVQSILKLSVKSISQNIKRKIMCLYSDTYRPVKADKAITCYKVVKKENSYGKPLFRSVFFSFTYELGKRYKNRKFNHYEPTGFVYDGFHSYANELHAKNNLWRDGKEVIIQCEIPAGSWYYTESLRDDFRKEYCSDRIRVVAWKEYDVKAGKCGEWGEWQYAPKYRLREYLKKIWPFT